MQTVYKKAIKCHGHKKEKGRQALVLHHQYPYHCFCYLVFPHRKHRDYSRIPYYIVCVLHLLVPVILSDISGHLRHCLRAPPLLHSYSLPVMFYSMLRLPPPASNINVLIFTFLVLIISFPIPILTRRTYLLRDQQARGGNSVTGYTWTCSEHVPIL